MDTVNQEEEDWACKFDETEAELDVKTESDQDVDLQSAYGSTVPSLLNDSITIKQEPTDTLEDAVTSQENGTLCSEIDCDTTIVKEEDLVGEAVVQESDVWLQRLARAHREQVEALQHDEKEKYDKDEETTVANNTARKDSIPVTVGSRKFVLVPHSTGNALAVANNTHKEQQLPLIKVIIRVLEDRNSKIKSNPQTLAPVAENVTTSVVNKVLSMSNTKPVSKVVSTAKPCLQPKVIQSPRKTNNHSIPDCIFQPKTKNKTADISKTNLKPAMNHVPQRSVTINQILEQSAKNFKTPLMMTKKTTPLATNKCLNIRGYLSYNNTPVVNKDSKQSKELRQSRSKDSQNLLTILETLKASKRAEAFKKVTPVPVETNHEKSPVANFNFKPKLQKAMKSNPTFVRTKIREIITVINSRRLQPIEAKATQKPNFIQPVPNAKPKPQKTMKSNPTFVKTKIREVLTVINSRRLQPIEAKATQKPVFSFKSDPTSLLEPFLRPCYVILERLKFLTCAFCRQQFYLKSQFIQHVFQNCRTSRIMPDVRCNICGKYYPHKYIKIHERNTHGPKKFWCDHCGKQCYDKASLIKHLVIHSDIKLYRCDVCNKRYRSKSNLLSHQVMHSSDMPYHCVICDRRFRRKTGLTKHSLYHLGLRPHQCKICDKRFCQISHLERHMRTHTGERRYACEICNKRFTRSSHRNRHMNVHMSKSRYTCEVCGKWFKERSRFEKHKRVHEEIE